VKRGRLVRVMPAQANRSTSSSARAA
jgi:hypothetical protein